MSAPGGGRGPAWSADRPAFRQTGLPFGRQACLSADRPAFRQTGVLQILTSSLPVCPPACRQTGRQTGNPHILPALYSSTYAGAKIESRCYGDRIRKSTLKRACSAQSDLADPGRRTMRCPRRFEARGAGKLVAGRQFGGKQANIGRSKRQGTAFGKTCAAVPCVGWEACRQSPRLHTECTADVTRKLSLWQRRKKAAHIAPPFGVLRRKGLTGCRWNTC